MPDINTNPHTYKKQTRQGAKRKRAASLEASISSVGQAINKARTCYMTDQVANHPMIEALEDWINYSPNTTHDDIYRNIELGHLCRSATSGRLFIQLLMS